MRPLALAAAGFACLGSAAGISAFSPSDPAGDAMASLGGARVLVVTALFLRAESLRREGRVEEIPAIYRRILEIDPGSESAIDFLADAESHDLMGLAPTAEARVRWWIDATDLVAEGLRKNPRSALLHWRAADLLLGVPDQHPEVAARLDGEKRDRLFEALLHLVTAARLAESLPRLAFLHLVGIARLAPRLAAERFAAGVPRAAVDEVLAIGNEVLRLRGDVMSQFILDPEPVPPPSAADRLRAGLRVVVMVRDHLAASPPRAAEAKALLDDYVSAVGRDAVASALLSLLPR